MNLGQRSPDLDKRGKTKTSGNIYHWKHPSDSCGCCVQERPGSQNLQNLDPDAQEEPVGSRRDRAARPACSEAWRRHLWGPSVPALPSGSGVIPGFRVLPVLLPSSSTCCNSRL